MATKLTSARMISTIVTCPVRANLEGRIFLSDRVDWTVHDVDSKTSTRAIYRAFDRDKWPEHLCPPTARLGSSAKVNTTDYRRFVAYAHNRTHTTAVALNTLVHRNFRGTFDYWCARRILDLYKRFAAYPFATGFAVSKTSKFGSSRD